VWVDTPRDIAIHYASRTFVMDVISVLPYDIFGILISEEAGSLRVRRAPCLLPTRHARAAAHLRSAKHVGGRWSRSCRSFSAVGALLLSWLHRHFLLSDGALLLTAAVGCDVGFWPLYATTYEWLVQLNSGQVAGLSTVYSFTLTYARTSSPTREWSHWLRLAPDCSFLNRAHYGCPLRAVTAQYGPKNASTSVKIHREFTLIVEGAPVDELFYALVPTGAAR